MRFPERWTPSKYVQRAGRWRASNDEREVGTGSRLVANAVVSRHALYLPRFARGRLVDLGCGRVPLYGVYAPLVDAVTCVDWAQSPHEGLHVDHAVDLAGPLPFADASFDTVILSDVLEHLPSPEALWREMARVLAPGGHAIVNVPFLYGIHEAPHDYGRYTEFALRRFASLAGFDVQLLEAVGGSAHVLADIAAKHLVHVPLLGRPMARGLQALVEAFDATAHGKRVRTTTATRFPLGYFLVAQRQLGAALRPA